MSVVITKEDTKKEGIMLLSDLKNTLKALEDFEGLEDSIKKIKEDLIIAENVAMYFQAKRENKKVFMQKLFINWSKIDLYKLSFSI